MHFSLKHSVAEKNWFWVSSRWSSSILNPVHLFHTPDWLLLYRVQQRLMGFVVFRVLNQTDRKTLIPKIAWFYNEVWWEQFEAEVLITNNLLICLLLMWSDNYWTIMMMIFEIFLKFPPSLSLCVCGVDRSNRCAQVCQQDLFQRRWTPELRPHVKMMDR